MKIWLNKNHSAFEIFALAFVLSYPVACRVYDYFNRPITGKILLILTIWAGFTGALWLMDLRYGFLASARNINKRTMAISGIVALISFFIFHWQPPAFPSIYHLEIQTEGQARLIHVTSGGKPFALDHFSAENGWSLSEGGWETSGTSGGNLVFSGSADAPLELVFATGPNSGTVIVSFQGHLAPVDLNSPMPDSAIIQTFPGSLGSPSIIWFLWTGLLLFCEFLAFSLLLYGLFTRWPYGTAAFLLPIVFLLPYVTTIAGHNVSLGNDFGPFYYVYKAYLLDFLSEGNLPLWSPSEGAGYPFFSNPLAQAMYPANVILALIYKINDGYTRLDHQIYTVMAVCWFSLGLYIWLRSLRVENRHALFAALTMALSYKMSELLRFPNAAHEAAWYPWILLALTRLFTARDWKTIARWSAGLFFSLICLFTAGYPYYVYYMPFLVAPYLLFMLIPRVRSVLFQVKRPDWRKFLVGFAIASLAALIVCAPYLYHMSQTITLTSGRGGDDYTHATMYPFDFLDTLESLVYPVAARPEGWFYFGALALTVIVLYLARPQHDSSSEDAAISERRTWPIKTALAGWLVFLSYLSYGEQSYLFLLFYKILPSFSALRGWGRLSITLLPGLALLFAYALADFESRLGEAKSERKIKSHTWIPLTALALISLGFQFYEFSRAMIDEYWSVYFIPRAGFLIQTVANVFGRDFDPDRAMLSSVFSFSYMACSLLAVLVVLFLTSRNGTFSHNHRKWILAGLGVFSAVNLWYGGPWLWNNGFTPKETREPGNYAGLMPAALKTPRKNENSTLTLSPSFSVGSPPKWHFSTYQDFYFNPDFNISARDELLGVTGKHRFYFSESITQPTIDMFLTDASRYDVIPEINEYTGDYLQLNVTVPSAGYFSFIDNWDKNWVTRVDGKPVKIEALFGTFKSAYIESGTHEISMAYCPQWFDWANEGCFE